LGAGKSVISEKQQRTGENDMLMEPLLKNDLLEGHTPIQFQLVLESPSQSVGVAVSGQVYEFQEGEVNGKGQVKL
jgi:hypothetical protein